MRQDRLFECADHVFFLNTEDQAEAEARVPGLSRRSSLLPHGIPAPQVVARTTADGNVAAFIGRFTRNKGIDVAAATAAGLIDRGTDWKFVFAGGHGDHAEEAMVRRLVRRYPAACHVTGWLSRGALEELYSRTALVLMPSRYEPFGMVALEAMSFGVPLLCSSALRPIVQPDSGGLIVEDHSAAAWIRTCESLMADSNARSRLSAQGPEYVRRGFNSPENARRFMHEIAA
jgi:glycosyltransferase involved in cell wall biosynthesis